jgi:hypothetical protein
MKDIVLNALGQNPGVTFFSRYFENVQIGKNVSCPFHEDKKPSLSIMNTGGWRCFSCGRHGDIFTFYGEMNNLNPGKPDGFRAILDGIAKEFNIHRNIQKPSIHDSFMSKLEAGQLSILFPDVLRRLQKYRGWTEGVIKKLKLGYKNGKVLIPIYKDNRLVNVRKYDVFHNDKNKFISIKNSVCPVWTFPDISENKEEIIYLFKESDVPLARVLGLNAYGITGGEGTWNSDLNQYIKDKWVYICYDTDMKGVAGQDIDPAYVVSTHIFDIVKEIRICRLPVVETDDGKHLDFTDFILASQDFNQVLKGAEIFKENKKIKLEDSVPEKKYKEINFSDCDNAKHFKENIKFKSLIIGTSESPFIIPKTIHWTCETGKDKCLTCPMIFHAGSKKIEINKKLNPLELVQVSNTQMIGILKRTIGNIKCSKLKMKVLDMQNIQELFITQGIASNTNGDDVFSLHRKESFLIGSQQIEPNVEYKISGQLTRNPKNQKAAILADRLDPLKASIDTFRGTEVEAGQDLSVFVPDTPGDSEHKMQEIVREVEINVTQIIGRRDIVLGTLLAYLSPLSFYFDGEYVKRGWMDILITGDSRTGKSKTVQRIMNYINLGTYYSCEKVTISGIVGGVQYIGKTPIVVWGVLPINNRGIVALDECSSLPVERFGDLSGVRSDGIAETITVAGARRAPAYVRKIWIGNARQRLLLRQHNNGIQLIERLIGNPEDIARFDFVIVCDERDVDKEIINSIKPRRLKERFSQHLTKLSLWAWSRKPEEIIFEESAIDKILSLAVQMSNDFTGSFPMILGAEQRIKIARMSISVATLLFSTDTDCQKIYVRNYHVDLAEKILYTFFENPNLGYRLLSDLRKEIRLNNTEIKSEINRLASNKKTFVRSMLSGQVFNITDFMLYTQKCRDETITFMGFLLREHCIKKARSGYSKTTEFKLLLEKINGEKNESNNIWQLHRDDART